MKTATENTEICLRHWVPGSRFFTTSDGKNMVIATDVTEYPSENYVRWNTAVLYCGERATVTDLVPDYVFPPGTTAEEALAEMGYELT